MSGHGLQAPFCRIPAKYRANLTLFLLELSCDAPRVLFVGLRQAHGGTQSLGGRESRVDDAYRHTNLTKRQGEMLVVTAGGFTANEKRWGIGVMGNWGQGIGVRP